MFIAEKEKKILHFEFRKAYNRLIITLEELQRSTALLGKPDSTPKVQSSWKMGNKAIVKR